MPECGAAIGNGGTGRENAADAVVQQSTLSRAQVALDRDGLIRRNADETDIRATKVFLTDAGHEIYGRLWPHRAAAIDAMFKGIDDAQEAAFVGILKTMLRNIRKHDF